MIYIRGYSCILGSFFATGVCPVVDNDPKLLQQEVFRSGVLHPGRRPRDLTSRGLTSRSLTSRGLKIRVRTSRGLTTRGFTSKGRTTTGLTYRGLTTRGLTCRGVTTRGLNSRSLPTRGLTSTDLTTRGLTSMVPENRGLTSRGVTTMGLTPRGPTSKGRTTRGLTYSSFTVGGTSSSRLHFLRSLRFSFPATAVGPSASEGRSSSRPLVRFSPQKTWRIIPFVPEKNFELDSWENLPLVSVVLNRTFVDSG